MDGRSDGVEAPPLQLARRGRHARGVSVILGTNRDEGSLFAPLAPLIDWDWHVPLDDEDVRKLLAHVLSGGGGETAIGEGGDGDGGGIDDLVDAVMARYPSPAGNRAAVDALALPLAAFKRVFSRWGATLGGRGDARDARGPRLDDGSRGDGSSTAARTGYDTQLGRLSAIISDQMFTCPARRMAAALSATNRVKDHEMAIRAPSLAERGGSVAPVWLYQFTYDVRWSGPLRTCHGSDVPYVFRRFRGLPPFSRDARMAAAFLRYWRDLAHSGDPNDPGEVIDGRSVGECGADCVAWPRWATGSTSTRGGVSLDLNLPAATVEGLSDDLCDFWDEVERNRTII